MSLCCASQSSNKKSSHKSKKDKSLAPPPDSKEYAAIKDKLIHADRLYEDTEFPPEKAGLVKSNNPGQIVWKRPPQICAQPIFIIDGISHDDIDQRALGNCWFLAPLASLLYKNPRHIMARLIPRDQGFQQYCGAFHFRFWEDAQWEDVIIDDRLPTRNGKLIYTSNDSQPNEFWMPLMEKAYAKLKGGYSGLHTGDSRIAFKNLTGNDVKVLYTSTPDHRTEFKKNLGLYTRMSTLMTANRKDVGKGEHLNKKSGLVSGHSYSIMDIKEVPTENGDKTLVHIRNPHGDGGAEWTGDWCDTSPLWNTIDPQFTFEHKADADGEFWMEIDQFFRHFDYIFIVFLMDVPNTQLNNINSNWYKKELIGRRDPDHPTRQWKKKKKPPPKKTKGKSTSITSNPQVEVSLDHSAVPTEVFVFLEEWDSSAVRNRIPTEPEVMKRNGDEVSWKKPSVYSEESEDHPELQDRHVVTRQFTLTLGAHEIVVIPCFIQPDNQAEFLLRVYCQEEFTLKTLEKPIKVK